MQAITNVLFERPDVLRNAVAVVIEEGDKRTTENDESQGSRAVRTVDVASEFHQLEV